MKIAYATTYNPKDKGQWSGLGYYIGKSLENVGLSVAYLGPLKDRFSLTATLKQRIYVKLFNRLFLRDRAPFLLEEYAEQIAVKLSRMIPDVVFSPGHIPVARLNSNLPVVVYTDSVFCQMIDFYPDYKRICQESIGHAIAMEKQSLRNCARVIYSSDWAANAAVELYDVSPEKVRVVPFGANIDFHLTINDIQRIVDARPCDRCKLIFLGVDWFRKGGDIALSVAEKLVQKGMKIELKIIGCIPESVDTLPDYVHVIGYISKEGCMDLRRFTAHLSEAHFLILPTRADCTPVVFSEANSFGVPCLSTQCGGIPSIIKDDVNGKLFPISFQPEEMAEFIFEKFQDYDCYKELAFSAYKEYRERLNWSSSGKRIQAILEELLC